MTNITPWLGSVCASALVCLSTGSLAQSALPKEGSIAVKSVSHATLKQVAMGEDFVLIIADSTTGWIADKPDGFGDGVTGRCVSSHRREKGRLEAETGACEFTDLTGDKFYSSWVL